VTGRRQRGRARVVRTEGLRFIERSSRLAEELLTPGGFHALRRWRPRSVSAFRLVVALRELALQPVTVLDVGANIGQFARAAWETWPLARIVAFEPLPEAAAVLRKTLDPAGGHRVDEVALGDFDGTVPFHSHHYHLSSSVLPSTDVARRRYRWAEESGSFEVRIRRLDSLLDELSIVRPVLLKIDVQGFELHVLRGAEKTLALVDAVVVEQSFDESYEGQPTFAEVYEHLAGRGWRLARVLDTRREGPLLAEVDCLYVRSPE
jgi:FkbM family methyltransferase